MPPVRVVLHEISGELSRVTETPRFEAELLLSHVTGWNKAQILTRLDEDMDGAGLQPLVSRRLAHEPIAYILGNWEFYGLELAIEAPLLVPRPETEHLVEVALPHIVSGESRVLDLCTGTGCVALALAAVGRPAELWATDLNPVAVRVATANAALHEFPIQVVGGDLFDALPDGVGPFNVIVSNPPYVEDGDWDGLAPDIRNYEDPGALLSGGDGLDCIRRIVATAPDWLVPGGLLALEMGESQGGAVCALLEGCGFGEVAIVKDLAGHERIAHGQWRG